VISRVIAPYDFAVGIDGDGNAVIWRVNSMTGDMEVCRSLGNLHEVPRSAVFHLSHNSPCP
jgi:hypothetical protein